MAVLFPVIGSIIAQWSALKESGLFVSLLTGHVQISSIFTLPISGALCASSGKAELDKRIYHQVDGPWFSTFMQCYALRYLSFGASFSGIIP